MIRGVPGTSGLPPRHRLVTRLVRAIREVRLVDGDDAENFALAYEWFRDIWSAEAISSQDPCGCGHDRWLHEHDRPESRRGR